MGPPVGAAAASELAQDLLPYWASRGPFGDVRRVLTSVAELAQQDSVPRARLLCVAAAMATSQNDYEACAERTVETHITNILNKLGLNSRIQLSRWIAELPA